MCSKRDYLQAFTHVSTHFIPTLVLETQQPPCQLGFYFTLGKKHQRRNEKSLQVVVHSRLEPLLMYQSGKKKSDSCCNLTSAFFIKSSKKWLCVLPQVETRTVG